LAGQTPVGELTALPRPLALAGFKRAYRYFYGEGEGRGGEGRGREGKGRERMRQEGIAPFPKS